MEQHDTPSCTLPVDHHAIGGSGFRIVAETLSSLAAVNRVPWGTSR
jgi:hypothetical protein